MSLCFSPPDNTFATGGFIIISVGTVIKIKIYAYFRVCRQMPPATCQQGICHLPCPPHAWCYQDNCHPLILPYSFLPFELLLYVTLAFIPNCLQNRCHPSLNKVILPWDICHPNYFPPKTFFTWGICHPRHLPFKAFAFQEICHPRHFPSKTFATQDICYLKPLAPNAWATQKPRPNGLWVMAFFTFSTPFFDLFWPLERTPVIGFWLEGCQMKAPFMRICETPWNFSILANN